MGDAGHQRDRLCFRGDVLFRLLLRHVALRPQRRNAAWPRATGAEGMRWTDAASKQRPSTARAGPDVAVEIIGLHKWYGEFQSCGTSTSRWRAASASSSAGRRAAASRRCCAASTGWRMAARPHRRRRHRTDRRSEADRRGAPRRRHGVPAFNLFPHLTVLENCTLAPIWVRRMPKKRCRGIGDDIISSA